MKKEAKTNKTKAAKADKRKRPHAPTNPGGRNGGAGGVFLYGFYVSPLERSKIETSLADMARQWAEKTESEVDKTPEPYCAMDERGYRDFYERAFKDVEHYLASGVWRDRKPAKAGKK